MRKLLIIWLLLSLSLSLGSKVPVIAREEQRFESKGTDYRPRIRMMGQEMWRRGDRQHLEELKKKDSERYEKVVRIGELRRESWQLAEEYKKAQDPEEKETIKADLKDLLNELFDLKQEEREAEMKRLEEKLKRLQENIIRRKENKRTIVNRRLREMTREDDYLQW